MAAKLYGADNAPLKIQFITDPHYYSRKGGTEGKAYEKAEAKSQKIIMTSGSSPPSFCTAHETFVSPRTGSQIFA